MGIGVKYISSKSEAEILALTASDPKWYDQGFYYPNDIPIKPYYYRIVSGSMVQYAGGDVSIVGLGITLNDKILAGIKTLIESSDILTIPENFDYNSYRLNISGVVNNTGQINIM